MKGSGVTGRAFRSDLARPDGLDLKNISPVCGLIQSNWYSKLGTWAPIPNLNYFSFKQYLNEN